MRLASIERNGRASVGVISERDSGPVLVDLAVANAELPRGMCKFLGGGERALAAAASVLDDVAEGLHGDAVLELADVTWLPVVPRPRKFLAIGLNYRAHAEETGRTPPEFPTVFNKQSTCANAHGRSILLPPETRAVDYEGELGIVIGQRCRRVSRDRASEVIAGFTIVNDVSVRDWQRRSPTMMMGKGWDSHGPMGPWLVTGDELGDPHDLRLRTFVNDEQRQEGHTGSLVFDCYEIIETLSTAFTLEPGDVIATGTPSGVGVAHDPPKFLRAGDVVRIEIDGIGTLENQVEDETV